MIETRRNSKLASKLRGRIKIKDGDDATFIAERTTEPVEPIPDPPSYRDKWQGRW
jgi:hypothetical protein